MRLTTIQARPGQARSRPGLARPEFVHSNVWTFLDCMQITGSLDYRIQVQVQLQIGIQIQIQIQNIYRYSAMLESFLPCWEVTDSSERVGIAQVHSFYAG